jgi:hypothetical protein
MKTKILTSILLVLLTIVFVYNGSTGTDGVYMPLAPGAGDSFILGAFQDGFDIVFDNYADTLGFNIWHMYNGSRKWGGRTYPDGWTHPVFAPGDSLFAEPNAYVSQVQGIMSTAIGHGKQVLLMRPKIEWLCFGQRSDYQCENVSGDLWFYSFNTRETGVPDTDSGQGVIHCRAEGSGPNHDDPGYVVRNLRANTEQCRKDWEFRGDSECDWLIKPRIRIDSNFAHNNPTTPVCSIKVIKQDEQTVLKNTIIRGINFLKFENGQFFYNGQYLEEFFNFQSSDDSLKIHGAWGDWWQYGARGYDNTAGADIQVYWYGNCDMWIDYVRVDNDIADQLFKGQREDWLQWEADSIACHLDGAASYNFYLELFEFNHIPCMSYVARKLRSYNADIGLMCVLNYSNYNTMIPFPDWDHIPGVDCYHIKRYLIDSIGSSEIFIGAYPFSGFPPNGSWGAYSWTKLPNTLPCGEQSYNADAGMLGYTVSAFSSSLSKFDSLCEV